MVELHDVERDADGYQVAANLVRVDTGELVKRVEGFGLDAPPGAMWWEDLTERCRPSGPDDWDHAELVRPAPGASRSPSYSFFDGPHLLVQTPGGQWNIDSRASNCKSPFDYEHRCWIRHGEPPAITVDKDGVTCEAGAGSIKVGDFHGFLRGGALVP